MSSDTQPKSFLDKEISVNLTTKVKFGLKSKAQTNITQASSQNTSILPYVLKSGCGIEKLQLETAKRLEMALATYSIVAWRLLYITHLARSATDASCEIMLEPPDK